MYFVLEKQERGGGLNSRGARKSWDEPRREKAKKQKSD